jgi:hypothetical protein
MGLRRNTALGEIWVPFRLAMMPVSTTNLTPSTVREVSARLVEITILRGSPLRRFASAFFCRSFSNVEMSGKTWPLYLPPSARSISSHAGVIVRVVGRKGEDVPEDLGLVELLSRAG